jgi:Methyltransferase domain
MASPEVDARDQRLHAESHESSWRGHTFRYRLAAGFARPGDTVVDAACGSGYGAEFFEGIEYVGVDNDPGLEPTIVANLGEWQPDFDFDVFVGFETLEHLPDYGAYVQAAKQAKRWIVLSTPVVPTTHLNPFHHHNFAPGELASIFIDDQWSYYQSVLQPSELSEICIFERR